MARAFVSPLHPLSHLHCPPQAESPAGLGCRVAWGQVTSPGHGAKHLPSAPRVAVLLNVLAHRRARGELLFQKMLYEGVLRAQPCPGHWGQHIRFSRAHRLPTRSPIRWLQLTGLS